MDARTETPNGTQRVRPEDVFREAMAPHLPYLDPDELVRRGGEFAANLPLNADPQTLEIQRRNIRAYAEALVECGLLQADVVSDAELEVLRSRYETEKSQVPYWKDARDAAWKELADLERERGLLGEEPRRPNLRVFAAVGTALGLAFGLVGATTVGDILYTLFPTESPLLRQRLFALGFVIALFIGLIVGLATLVVRKWAVGAGFFGRWGPLVGGFFMAAGLAGYRLLHEEASGGLALRVTAVGLVLSFVELAILIAIAVVDDVLLNAWDRWETGRVEIARKDEQIRRAREELERREAALAKEEREAAEALGQLEEARRRRGLAERLRSHRDLYVDYAAQIMLSAFEAEWRRRLAAGALG